MRLKFQGSVEPKPEVPEEPLQALGGPQVLVRQEVCLCVRVDRRSGIADRGAGEGSSGR